MPTQETSSFKDVFRAMTPDEKRKARAIRDHVTAHLPEWKAKGHAARMRHDALLNAMKLLKAEREAKGLSLADLSRLTGIDKSRLAKLEKDPRPNPTLDTLTRIATALHADLTLVIRAA